MRGKREMTKSQKYANKLDGNKNSICFSQYEHIIKMLMTRAGQRPTELSCIINSLQNWQY